VANNFTVQNITWST